MAPDTSDDSRWAIVGLWALASSLGLALVAGSTHDDIAIRVLGVSVLLAAVGLTLGWTRKPWGGSGDRISPLPR